MRLPMNKIWPALAGIGAILLYISPWLLGGESSYVRIHDTLDSNLVWYKIMTEHRFWFEPNLSMVGPIFEQGLPRISYPNELSIITLLFAWLDPYWAYVANQFILRLIAFLGMYVFLRRIPPSAESKHIIHIVFWVSLCYAFLPYWAFGGAAVAGLPWVFYSAFRAWRGEFGKADAFILFAYPFYSHIVLTGMFVVGMLWVLIPVAYTLKRRVCGIFIAAVISTISHLLVNHRYVEFALFGGFVPQRVDYVMPHNSLGVVWEEILRIFRHGEWAITLHGSVIFFTVLATLLLIVVSRLWQRYSYRDGRIRKDLLPREYTHMLGFIVLACLIMSIYCGLWFWDPITTWREKTPILIYINFTRITFFMPFFWMVAFGYALFILAHTKRRSLGYLIVGLVIAQLWIELGKHEYLEEKRQTGITYAQFFSKSLFDDIANALPGDRSSYVVGSLGIHPSIAQFNGFRTADGFLALYPKEYKVKFRRAVVNEFKLRPDLLKYFDEWGSSAYFYTTERWCPRDGAVCKKTTPFPPIPVHFDIAAMRDLGVKYLFSVTPLSNANDLGLTLVGTFENEVSVWRISVYRLPEKIS